MVTASSLYQQQTNAMGATTRGFRFWNPARARSRKWSSRRAIPLSGGTEYSGRRSVGEQHTRSPSNSARSVRRNSRSIRWLVRRVRRIRSEYHPVWSDSAEEGWRKRLIASYPGVATKRPEHTGNSCQTLRRRCKVWSSSEVVRHPGQGVAPPPSIHRAWRRGGGRPGGQGPDSTTKVSRPRSSESPRVERNVPKYKESFLLGRYAWNGA